MIIVLDCNIWISLTLNKQIDFITNLFNAGFTIATCRELRNEIIDVFKRPKFNKFISSFDIEKVIDLHDKITMSYKLGRIVNVTADVKDDYLFALCDKAKADYFVTGDKILLEVALYKNTKLLNLSEFKQLLEL